jgi:hypothetical protein
VEGGTTVRGGVQWWEEVSDGGEEGTEKEFDRRWRGRGEELNEAAVMSSTVRGGNELDESDVEELGDEDHDREDKDGGEELDEVVAMTSTVDGDELNEGRGRAHGMTMVMRRGRS